MKENFVISATESSLLTWDTLGYPGPGPVLADGGGVVRLLELGEALHVDRLAVRHRRPRRAVAHEPVRHVRDHARG